MHPKWCASTGATDANSVCVCTHYQNVDVLSGVVETCANWCAIIQVWNAWSIDVKSTQVLKYVLDKELEEMDPEEEFDLSVTWLIGRMVSNKPI